MKRIVEQSSQNVNSNAEIFLAKQILDSIPSLGKFDSCQQTLFLDAQGNAQRPVGRFRRPKRA